MNVGIIGCGFVFDKYMATWANYPSLKFVGVADIDPGRVKAVSNYYGVRGYPDNAALLADPSVEIVANFTPITAHYSVTRAALEAGKHVYSEKPLVTRMDQAHELFSIARDRGVRLSCAPSNALGATTQTMWKVVRDGAIGDVRLIYAEFDTSPLYLRNTDECPPSKDASFPFLHEKSQRTVSGAYFPWLHEFEMGCTFEHVGYHLSWMCAICGPVKSVTAFSKQIMPDKTNRQLDPPDTPDFSVAVLNFHSGAVGRVTCSIAGPHDNRMRIVGNRGLVHTFTYGDYRCPVYLEPFSRLTNKARYFRGADSNRILSRLFGIGGRNVPLAPDGPPTITGRKRFNLNPRRTARHVALRHRILGYQDKCIGIAELADAIRSSRPHFPSPEFTLHLTELTLAIQGAGTESRTHVMDTTFEPVDLPQRTIQCGIDYRKYLKLPLLGRIAESILAWKT
jgi:predicted dehydrogenase